MSIYTYKCNCGNTSDFFIEHNLSQCGLYCGECGKWQKWLNKDEERLFKHKQSINEHDANVRAEVYKGILNKIYQVYESEERGADDFKVRQFCNKLSKCLKEDYYNGRN